MIICSCNVLTDGEVKSCMDGTAAAPRTAAEVYAALGCAPRCGRCATTIRSILKENAVNCCSCDEACDCLPSRPALEEASAETV